MLNLMIHLVGSIFAVVSCAQRKSLLNSKHAQSVAPVSRLCKFIDPKDTFAM